MKFFKLKFKKSKPAEGDETQLEVTLEKEEKGAGEMPASPPDEETFWQLPEGIDKEIMNHLKRMLPVDTLQAGEYLIEENEEQAAVFIILAGAVRVEKEIAGKRERIATLKEGTLVGELAFTKRRPGKATVMAEQTSKVMRLDRKTFESLGESVQLILLKRMNEQAAHRLDQQQAKEDELAGRNLMLAEQLYGARTRTPTDHLDSKLIRDIIENSPRLPVFASTMASRMLSEEISTGEITDELKKDPTVAALVLKTVNSPFYGFHQKIADIHDAVLILGIDNIYQLVVAEGIRQAMPDTPIFRELHFHSQAISHIASQIAKESDTGNPSQVATIGLMHDLGHIVTELLRTQNPKTASLIDLIDHTRVGGLLMQTWDLPEKIWKTIEFQSHPEFSHPDRIPEEIRESVAILYTAHLCYEIFWDTMTEKIPEPFIGEYLRVLNWEAVPIEEIAGDRILRRMKRDVKRYPLPLRELIQKNA